MTQEDKSAALELPTEKDDATKKVAEEEEAEDGGDDSDKKEEVNLEMVDYIYPSNQYELIQKRWGFFTLYTLPFYLISLFFAVYGVDQYTDIEGRAKCGAKTPE